jgi:Thioredoxin
MTYKDFKTMLAEEVKNVKPKNLNGINKKYYEYRKINLQRSNRLDKQFQPSEKLIDIVRRIDEHQLWMVITETWCGDSAQCLPIIAKTATLNDKIDLRILLRDSNFDIIDHYLTNGKSRSIPILVAFDLEGAELFKWGPRPETAKTLVANLKSMGFSKEEFNTKLHLWYGRNKGKDLESEIIQLLMKLKTSTKSEIRIT